MSRLPHDLPADRRRVLYVKLNSFQCSGISRIVLVHKEVSMFVKCVYGHMLLQHVARNVQPLASCSSTYPCAELPSWKFLSVQRGVVAWTQEVK